MPKVITSQGLAEFTQTGKPTEVFDRSKSLSENLAKLDAPKDATPPPPVPPPEAPPEEADESDEDKDLPERARKAVNKKHRAMKEAQEAAEESERFAENQFNENKANQKRIADLEAKLSGLEKPEPVKEEAKKPLSKDFVTDGKFDEEAYSDALTAYTKQEALKELRAEEISRQEAAQKAEVQSKFEAFKKSAPDWDSVVSGSKSLLPNPVLEYIMASEYGPHLYYHFSKNEADAARVMDVFNAELKRNPGDAGLRRAAMKAVAVVAKVETSFEKPAVAIPAAPKAVIPGAPAPITPIGGSGEGSVNTDPSKMSFQELRAYHKAKAKR